VRPGQQAWQGKAWHGKARGTRHESWRDLTPCLGLTNARMRPGANAHTRPPRRPPSAAASCALVPLPPSPTSLSLSLSLPLSLRLSFFLCLMTLPEFGISNCNRFLDLYVRLPPQTRQDSPSPPSLPPPSIHSPSLPLSLSLSLSHSRFVDLPLLIPLICRFCRQSSRQLEYRETYLLHYEPIESFF